MQKNKIKLSKKIIGMGVTSVAVLCLHTTSAQQPPRRSIVFQIPKISQPISREQLEENLPAIVSASSAAVTSSNGTEKVITIPNNKLPDMMAEMTRAQKYCDDLIRSGVPKDEAIRQMQIAIFSGQFDGNKTGNAAPPDGCNIV